MIYKGYLGVLDIDEDSGELYGRVVGISDGISFVGRTVDEARRSFQESVDFYLERCAATGKVPDRPFSGRYTIHLSESLHRAVAIRAAAADLTMNDAITEALQLWLGPNPAPAGQVASTAKA